MSNDNDTTTSSGQVNNSNTDTPVSRTRSARRPRQGPMKPAQRKHAQDTFLESFAQLGNVTIGCRAANINRSTVYDWLERDTEFTVRYHQAEEQAADMLEAEAFRRAVRGVEKTVISMGKIVYVDGKPFTEREYSDTLLLNMLRARNKRYKPQMDVTSGGEQVRAVFVLPDLIDSGESLDIDAVMQRQKIRENTKGD